MVGAAFVHASMLLIAPIGGIIHASPALCVSCGASSSDPKMISWRGSVSKDDLIQAKISRLRGHVGTSLNAEPDTQFEAWAEGMICTC